MTTPDTPSIDWSLAERWYDENADTFEMATLGMQVSPFLSTFCAKLPEGARVLDAGCGAGRDARWMLDRGFDVGAFDISREMCVITRANSGHRIEPRWLDFRDYGDAPGSWDGIWALASLIHLPRRDVISVLPRLAASLTESGLLAFAVKRGEGEAIDARGRPMSYFEPSEIAQMALDAMGGHGLVQTEMVLSPDSSGAQAAWINVMATRVPTS